ncbi:MAG: hypothetical protein NTW50_02575 [Candidatus Berkelbacteria bacterium]|nr:hypothetical protein [Candidatus Berkelbacteria bacterium]
MNILTTIFTFYDHLISSFPVELQFCLSLAVLLLFVGAIIGSMKHGHWLFFLFLIILIPGAWPAAKNIVGILWQIVQFLWVRISINIPFGAK